VQIDISRQRVKAKNFKITCDVTHLPMILPTAEISLRPFNTT